MPVLFTLKMLSISNFLAVPGPTAAQLPVPRARQGSGWSTLHLEMDHHHQTTTSRCSTATLRCCAGDDLP